MKKLEDIPKKEIFNVPDDYFAKLPKSIHARTIHQKKGRLQQPVFSGALRYGIPVLLLFVCITLWLNRTTVPSDSESILSLVPTEDLIAYLNDTDLTTDELLEAVNFNTNDLNEIEEQVYHLNLNDKAFEDAVNEIDLDTL